MNTPPNLWHERLKREIGELVKINPHRRPWTLPLAAALSAGLPLFVGMYFGHFEYGLVSSLGGMTFLYLPATRLVHRMVTLLSVAALMSASFLCGLVAYHFPALLVLMIVVLTMLTTMLCRFFKINPPGNLFFLMSAMIAAYLPHSVGEIPMLVGLMFLGGLLACAIGFVYSLYTLWRGAPVQAPPEPVRDVKLVVVDALITGLCVGLALFLADMLQMPKPYWVPVACVAVMQGITFRAVWVKQVHRIVGTAVGLGLAWLLLMLHPQGWFLCMIMMLLSFVIELLVVRHYAAAVVFITPLTIFLAEAGGGAMSAGLLIESRFFDTLLGCAIGLIGAACLHFLGLRNWLERVLLQLYAYGARK